MWRNSTLCVTHHIAAHQPSLDARVTAAGPGLTNATGLPTRISRCARHSRRDRRLASRLVRPIVAPNIERAIVAPPNDAHQPWIAAHLAILHQLTADIRLHVDLNHLAAVGARHLEAVVHGQGRASSMRLVQANERANSPSMALRPLSARWRVPVPVKCRCAMVGSSESRRCHSDCCHRNQASRS